MANRGLAIGLMLAAIVAVVYGRICTHEFTYWDDPFTLHANPRMNPPTVKGIAWYWGWEWKPGDIPRPHVQEQTYYPLTLTVWGLLARVAYLETPNEFGIHLNPWVFHTASVAVHILSVLCVYALLRRILKRDWPAIVGALFFGLHPVQVESVAWASGMKDLLWGLFAIISIWQYLIFAETGSKGRYAVALLAFIAAMFAKPTGMIVPLLVASVDLWIAQRPISQVARSLWPWLILSILCAITTKLGQPGTGLDLPPAWTRPLVAADALAFYLGRLVWPVGLVPDYARKPTWVMSHWWVWVIWIIPASVGLAIWFARKKAPALVAVGLLYLFGVAPVLGFSPFVFQGFSTTSDHYLYTAMLGPALAAGWVVLRFPLRSVSIAAGVVLAVLGGLAAHQAGYWRDDYTIWEHTVEVNPRSSPAWVSLGNSLIRRGRMSEAGPALARGVELDPKYARARNAYAAWLMQMGRVDEAIDQIRAVIRLSESYPPSIRPDNTENYFALGQQLMKRGRYAEAAEAFEQTLARKPDHAGAMKGLAQARAAMKSTKPATRPD